MTTLATTRVNAIGDTRETFLAEVLAAAHRLGSNLRGTFGLSDLSASTGSTDWRTALAVARLEGEGRWPYVEIYEGAWRDPRPWYERIAVEMSAAMEAAR